MPFGDVVILVIPDASIDVLICSAETCIHSAVIAGNSAPFYGIAVQMAFEVKSIERQYADGSPVHYEISPKEAHDSPKNMKYIIRMVLLRIANIDLSAAAEAYLLWIGLADEKTAF